MQAYCFVLLLSPFWPFFAKSGRPPRGASQGTVHGCQLHFQSPHSILVYPTCVSSSITQVIAWKSILPASNGATKSTKPSVSAESRTLTELTVPKWAAPGQVRGPGRVMALSLSPPYILLQALKLLQKRVILCHLAKQLPDSVPSLDRRAPKAVGERMEVSAQRAPACPSILFQQELLGLWVTLALFHFEALFIFSNPQAMSSSQERSLALCLYN